MTRRSRQERAFERLYRRHVGDVYRYALAVLGNPADAEDVTQTAFLNAYRAVQQGEWPQRPLNWLITIAHNVCRQRFRQAMRRPNEVALLDHDAAAELVEDDVPPAEEIQRALSQLAFNQRAALVMRELEGRSYAEIANALGMSSAAVEALLFRARRALREQLEGSLACSEVERAISRQLDGRLERAELGKLRAHLRACDECATLARRMRATRSGLKSLALIPLPSSLGSFFGAGTGATVGTGLALKAAIVGASAVVVASTGYEAVKHVDAGSGVAVASARSIEPSTPVARGHAVAFYRASSTVPSHAREVRPSPHPDGPPVQARKPAKVHANPAAQPAQGRASAAVQHYPSPRSHDSTASKSAPARKPTQRSPGRAQVKRSGTDHGNAGPMTPKQSQPSGGKPAQASSTQCTSDPVAALATVVGAAAAQCSQGTPASPSSDAHGVKPVR